MDSAAVQRHYGRPDMEARVLDALRRTGLDPDDLRPEDLEPLDQFHTQGRFSTLRLAELAGVREDERVLDAGAGLAGPARMLARAFGCQVTAVDLTEEFCRTAATLTRLVGLEDRVDVVQGDVLDLPFPDASFDLFWSQHAAMNIADKPRLYAEAARVLRPGGRLALFDYLAGPGGSPFYPVPWADGEEISFLAEPDELRAMLGAAGFRIDAWEDRTAEAGSFVRTVLAEMAGGPAPSLGLHVFVADMRTKFENLARGIEADRLRAMEVVAYWK